jgi:hypothetical protein
MIDENEERIVNTLPPRMQAELRRRRDHMWEEANKLEVDGLLHMDCAARPAKVLLVKKEPEVVEVIVTDEADTEGIARARISFYRDSHVTEFEWAGGFVITTLINASPPTKE